MTGREFSEFIKRKNAQAEEEKSVDWNRRREQWLSELDNLFSKMIRDLEPYTNTHEIEIERTLTSLKEDYIGTYEAEMLTFKIGRDKVFATPIGTLLIGSRGRVDLSGPKSTLRIVLLDRDDPPINTATDRGDRVKQLGRPLALGEIQKSSWYIATEPPKSVFIPLAADSFQDALMEVIGE